MMILRFLEQISNDFDMKLTFIRHAHSDPSGNDLERHLSSKGIKQALSLSKLTKDIDYDLVIHSSALRTKETVDILFYLHVLKPQTLEMSNLYLPTCESDINEISKAVMLHPHAIPYDILRRDKSNAWQRYSEEAYNSLKDIVVGKSNILIVGHRTILNLIADRLSPDKQLKHRYLGTLEGFSIDLK